MDRVPHGHSSPCVASSRGATSRSTSALAILAITVGVAWQGSIATSTTAQAKTPGKTYCFLGTCHRVRTLDETRKAVGVQQVVKTSYYDDPKKDRYNPSNLTSSGEWFRASEPDNAASPIWPNGTKILVWNPVNKRAAMLRINNAGPYWGKRTLDVSRGAADRLGFLRSGVATLQAKVVEAPTPSEASYKKGRRYAAVPGFMGIFETIDLALANAARALNSVVPPILPGQTVVASAEAASTAQTATGSPPVASKTSRRRGTQSSEAKVAALSPPAAKSAAARAVSGSTGSTADAASIQPTQPDVPTTSQVPAVVADISGQAADHASTATAATTDAAAYFGQVSSAPSASAPADTLVTGGQTSQEAAIMAAIAAAVRETTAGTVTTTGIAVRRTQASRAVALRVPSTNLQLARKTDGATQTLRVARATPAAIRTKASSLDVAARKVANKTAIATASGSLNPFRGVRQQAQRAGQVRVAQLRAAQAKPSRARPTYSRSAEDDDWDD